MPNFPFQYLLDTFFFPNADHSCKLPNRMSTSSVILYILKPAVKSFITLIYREESLFILGVDTHNQEQISTNYTKPMHPILLFLKILLRGLWIAVVFTFVLQQTSVCRSCFTASGISGFVLIENQNDNLCLALPYWTTAMLYFINFLAVLCIHLTAYVKP